MRWELRDATTQDVILHSVPLSAADTVSQNWCLSEGCYELVWNDEGGMDSPDLTAENLAGMR